MQLTHPHPQARNSDPITSHAAADSIRGISSAQRERIVKVLASSGPLGAEQIGDVMRLDAYAIRKRTAELQHEKLIEPTGDTRRTRTGRAERIWRLVPKQLGLV